MCVFQPTVENYIQEKEKKRSIFYLIHVGLGKAKTVKIEYTTQVPAPAMQAQRLLK